MEDMWWWVLGFGWLVMRRWKKWGRLSLDFVLFSVTRMKVILSLAAFALANEDLEPDRISAGYRLVLSGLSVLPDTTSACFWLLLDVFICICNHKTDSPASETYDVLSTIIGTV